MKKNASRAIYPAYTATWVNSIPISWIASSSFFAVGLQCRHLLLDLALDLRLECLRVVRPAVPGHQLIDIDDQEPGFLVDRDILREGHGQVSGIRSVGGY